MSGIVKSHLRTELDRCEVLSLVADTSIRFAYMETNGVFDEACDTVIRNFVARLDRISIIGE